MKTSEQKHNIRCNDSPKVTIITVTYNRGTSLKKAFESVANQSYDNIEFIVIDGGSTDETIQTISEYEQYISYWVSEPDTGIYNAMNKGIEHASGELVYFLNSDDYFYDNRVVEDVVNLYIRSDRPDVIYGDVMTYSSYRKVKGRLGRKIGLGEVKKGRVICHQSIFMKRELLQKYRFNEEYKIAADYELQIKCLKAKHRFLYIDRVIAYYSMDGVSSVETGKRDTIFEKMRIIKSHFDAVAFYRFYFFTKLKFFRVSVRRALRGLLNK